MIDFFCLFFPLVKSNERHMNCLKLNRSCFMRTAFGGHVRFEKSKCKSQLFMAKFSRQLVLNFPLTRLTYGLLLQKPVLN